MRGEGSKLSRILIFGTILYYITVFVYCKSYFSYFSIPFTLFNIPYTFYVNIIYENTIYIINSILVFLFYIILLEIIVVLTPERLFGVDVENRFRNLLENKKSALKIIATFLYIITYLNISTHGFPYSFYLPFYISSDRFFAVTRIVAVNLFILLLIYIKLSHPRYISFSYYLRIHKYLNADNFCITLIFLAIVLSSNYHGYVDARYLAGGGEFVNIELTEPDNFLEHKDLILVMKDGNCYYLAEKTPMSLYPLFLTNGSYYWSEKTEMKQIPEVYVVPDDKIKKISFNNSGLLLYGMASGP